MNPSRILVVEDEFIVALEIGERLSAMGYRVVGSAADGERALELVSRSRPDLVLMDIRLQGEMDGIGAAQEIHRRFHLPVIFLTAYSEDATLERAKLAEPYGYILKPFDDRELKSGIEIALHKHSAEEEIRRLNRLYDVLSQVNQAVVRSKFREELLSAVCRLVVERGAVDLAWIGWLDPATARIEPVAQFGDRCEIPGEAELYADSGPKGRSNLGRAILEGKPIICNDCPGRDCLHPASHAPVRFGFHSCASFPIRFRNQVRGALSLYVREAGFFREREVRLLEEVALDVSFALDKIESEARRERAEEALRESEARLRLFIEHAPASLAMFDRDMRYLSVSRRWLSDYNLGERNLIGLRHYEVFPEVPEYWKNVHRRGLSGEVIRAESDRFERADGSVQWLRWEVRPWRSHAGNVGGIVIFSEDITERRQAEEALRASEEQFRAMFETASIGIAQADPKTGRFLRVNRKMCEITGYSTNEMQAMRIPEITHPEDREDDWKAYQGVMTGELKDYRQEKRYIRKDGVVVWVNVNMTVIRDFAGEPMRAMATIEDITDRKRAEERLKEYEKVVEGSEELIAVVDRDYRYLLANRAFLDYRELEREQVVGHPVAEVLGREVFETVIKEKLDECFRGNVVKYGMKYAYPRLGERDLFITYLPIRGHAGVDRAGCIQQDVTERRRLEEERARAEVQLRQAQKMEAIGLLAGGIAHDFNNILSAIIGFSELALGGVSDESDLREDLQQVLNAGLRAKELVKQILTFSRQTEREPAPVELTYIVKEAVKMLRATLPSTISITHELAASSLSRTLTDPTEIHQVVMNLCTNAAYAMREEGGVLHVELTEALFSEGDPAPHPDLKPGSYLKLMVSDTGCGMSEEAVTQIFDPFFTTKPRGEGTGMGLSVVHGIVKSCSGAITVDSKPGVGTAFWAYFPKAESEGSDGGDTSEEVHKGKGRILFVDDEEPLVKLGKKMLERLGYRVTTRTSSREALEAVKAMPYWFDLIITDYTMPHMTGLILAREAKTIRPDIPVIVCSGHNEKINPETASSFDIEAFVPKPVDIKALSKLINQIIER